MSEKILRARIEQLRKEMDEQEAIDAEDGNHAAAATTEYWFDKLTALLTATNTRGDTWSRSPGDCPGQGDTMKNGATLIAAERQRQVLVEGWTPEHDDMHDGGELAMAAACYAAAAALQRIYVLDDSGGTLVFSDPWPWDLVDDKRGRNPASRKRAVRLLTKAGALIAAEIDRLQRVTQSTATGEEDR